MRYPSSLLVTKGGLHWEAGEGLFLMEHREVGTRQSLRSFPNPKHSMTPLTDLTGLLPFVIQTWSFFTPVKQEQYFFTTLQGCETEIPFNYNWNTGSDLGDIVLTRFWPKLLGSIVTAGNPKLSFRTQICVLFNITKMDDQPLKMRL